MEWLVRAWRISVCLSCFALLVCLACGTVEAREVHVFKSVFGATGSGQVQFKGPEGIAVDNSTGDIYAADTDNNRVEKIDPSGPSLVCELLDSADKPFLFSEATELAVDNAESPLDASKRDVYVVDRGAGVIDKFDSNCDYVTQLTGGDVPQGSFQGGAGSARALQGVAVSVVNGSLLVAVKKGSLIRFNSEISNSYQQEIETIYGGTSEGVIFGGASESLGVDSEGRIYLNTGGGQFAEVSSTGTVIAKRFCGDERAIRLTVDETDNVVFLDNEGEEVEACSSAGELIERFGLGHLTFSRGIAINEADGLVYATDQSENRVAVFEAVSLPDVSVGGITERSTHSVLLEGVINPHGTSVTSCAFEYSTATEFNTSHSYSHSASCSPTDVGSGTAPVAVSAHLEGLVPETEYAYRLMAENAAHIPSVTENHDFFVGPRLDDEFATGVSSTSVVLNNVVDANGLDLHYYVEYGLSTGYGLLAPLPAPPGGDAGSSSGEQKIVVHLQDLTPGTSYHYRFVAIQAGETFAQTDHEFTTQIGVEEGSLLIDGRKWELVSPPDKRGALIELFKNGDQVQAAANGGGISYATEGGSVDGSPSGKEELEQILSRRGSNGWSSTDLTLPAQPVGNEEPEEQAFFDRSQTEYPLLSSDLSLSLVEPRPAGTPLLSPQATTRTLYLRDDLTDAFTPLVYPGDVREGATIEEENFAGVEPAEWQMHFVAGTSDLTHVLLKTPMALTPEAVDEETVQKEIHGRVQWNLYEWSDAGLKLINVRPNGEVVHGPYPAPQVRPAGGSSSTGLSHGGVPRIMSNDGRWVAWTWGQPYGEESKAYKGLFLRDTVEERTVQVGGIGAVFQTMNSDGSKVFYLENGDLFEYNTASETSENLTKMPLVGEHAGVQELVSDVSDNGQYVYFVATGSLAGGATLNGYNLYLLHDSESGWTTSYIATLSLEDRPSWYAERLEGAPMLSQISSRVSPDGRFLAFMSNRPLTGYDNIDVNSGKADEEVYLYSADAGRLVCASCNPTGERPIGVLDTQTTEPLVDRTAIWTEQGLSSENPRFDHWLAGSVPGWDEFEGRPSSYQPRYLSDSGRLFFDSADSLVPLDSNGVEDVYEFEPEGAGGCTSSTASGLDVYVGAVAGSPVDGCVGLISSGTSSNESAFYDATEDGSEVFFDTSSKLIGEDFDEGYDLYDAHTCTSTVPCRESVAAPPPCTSSDACKGPPSSQPSIFGAPPSATFVGAGDQTAGAPSVKPKTLTRSQQLTRALKACRHKKQKHRRKRCERQAHKRFPDLHASVVTGVKGGR